ncbi:MULTISPECIES: DUF2062 domain-containing protein [Kaistia]|uniref:DUF2062 domain-containing protein n=1 Tax=Kaistia nematophila TaxID=2994654 RepID=A0A9X3E0H0_9HYPH|nr:DUF2062 domain-containing protein [Kaistia nematophila]MBN9024920.1 DUF2062 domain-containing protein [Hyphomicrobiales bacterium]MBN9060105.1 DUF2062 domain-containing protein [Hyphomicrobiales bacterium]MCX5568861.1 DUF2062 domain-containing protein [Kaistia nematophila]
MLFRRRRPLKFHQKLNHFMWPKGGWKRAIRYYVKRLLRLSGSPHSIAAGFAAGVALAMTPFIGFHYLLCFAVAFLVRGNVLAAVLGTTIGNPLTFPLIWVGTYETGSLVLGWFGQSPERLGFHDLRHKLLTESWREIWPIMEPMLVGAVPLALVLGGISYVLVYFAAQGFQSSRRHRFAVRRQALHGK